MSKNNDEYANKIISEFEKKKEEFDNNLKEKINGNHKFNLSSLFEKSDDKYKNQLINCYFDLVQKAQNIPIILRQGLDFKFWNSIIEKINLVIKTDIDIKHFKRNAQVIIQNIYSSSIEELKEIFQFYKLTYRNIYKLEIPAEQEKQLNEVLKKYASNVLNFMGDIKKLKLTLNKRFYTFRDLINLDTYNKKDAEDAIKFFLYSLDNDINNCNVYNNLAFVYKEFLEDDVNVIYWYTKGFTFIFQKHENINKIRDYLEKEFEIIRQKENKKAYVIHENIDDLTFLKYDLIYFHILFSNMIGILFKKIDVDKLDNYNDNFKILISRILKYYSTIINEYNMNYDLINDCAKMIMLAIFSFHYSLDHLNMDDMNENNINKPMSSAYSNESENIILNEKYNFLLKFKLYNHNITSKMKENIKLNLKESLKLITQFTKCMITYMNEVNYNIVEKFLLILFYWLSLNYDMFNLIIDEEEKTHLRFLNYYLRNLNEVKTFLNPNSKVTLNLLIDKINNYILPLETHFICFSPMHRFFELNKKPNGFYHYQEKQESFMMNKIILIHFLDLFGLFQQNNSGISAKFYCKSNITIKNVSDTNSIHQNINLIKKQLDKKENILTIEKKEKPLIVLDASNIAMRHGERTNTYSTKGIEIAIDFFL